MGTTTIGSGDTYVVSNPGTVTSVSGTTNRITVATGTTTPVIDISASYVGQTSITTLASNLALGGSPTTTTQSAGDATTKVATTSFVTTAIANAIAGVNPAESVLLATTAAGDTSGLTYANGTAGVGATFTGTVNTALTIDGTALTAVNQRALVKNDTQSPSGAFNGIYYLTQLQTVSLPPILTRALDYNTPTEINNSGIVPVISGTANGGTSWLLTSTVTTIGTNALTYAKFTDNPSNVTITGGTINGTVIGGSTPAAGTFSTLAATTFTSGAWNGTLISPAYGGTGVANNASSTLTISGSFGTTLTVTGTTGVTLPTSGTLTTLATVVGSTNTWTAVQTFTNSDIRLLGSSSGYTTFASANAGASNFTLTFPATTDTVTTNAGASIAFTGGTINGVTIGGSTPAAVTATTLTATAFIQPFTKLTDAATVAVDLSTGNNFSLTLGGNRTLGTPTNITAGQSGVIAVRQDITGSRTLAYTWPYQFVGGAAPTLSTGKAVLDELMYIVTSYSTSTVTMTIASPCVVTWTAHGLTTGQRVQFTTSGALPTGLTASTTYWVTVIDANTFNLSTSLANTQTATFINTSGSQNGTHTAVNMGITLTINPAVA